MTGGQDRAAAVRRVALAAAVRVPSVREAIASTATPPLKAGGLRHGTRRPGRRGVRPGSLIANPLVRVKGPGLVRLDTVLGGQLAVLTAREPDQALAGFCERCGLALLRIRAAPRQEDNPAQVRAACRPEDNPARAPEAADGGVPKADWTDVCLAAGDPAGPMRALIADPGLSVLVRPDGVIATIATGGRLPELPWPIRPRASPQLPDAYPAPRPDATSPVGS
jgi:hypothetical protein